MASYPKMLETGCSRNHVWILGMGKKCFSLLRNVQTCSGARDVNPITQPPFNVEFNEWSYTPRPPICLFDMHRGNCNVTLHIDFE